VTTHAPPPRTSRTDGAGPHAPTLHEVAALSGVSRATVSRVMNDSPRVSPEARRAVQEAVEQLRYVPNRMARSLVTRRTDTIALVLSEQDTQVFSDPFFASIVRGVSANLVTTDLNLVLLTARGAREQEKAARYVQQGHVDGVILISLHGDDTLAAALDRAGVPVVLLGRPLDGRPVAYVDADNVGGASAATRLLLDLGRTCVGTVTGPRDMVAGADRYTGYEAALRSAGLSAAGELVEEGDFTEEGGHRAAAALLRRVPDLDGLFVASDPMAAGALRALREAGRRVPDDVAVVGFDDAAVALACEPPLTTVAQPIEDMARRLTDLLLRRIEGDAAGEAQVCPTRLVRRGSA
jgi:DNA-binding LacI/PurR family transcriptional regulator